jgi:hypothetical protein
VDKEPKKVYRPQKGSAPATGPGGQRFRERERGSDEAAIALSPGLRIQRVILFKLQRIDGSETLGMRSAPGCSAERTFLYKGAVECQPEFRQVHRMRRFQRLAQMRRRRFVPFAAVQYANQCGRGRQRRGDKAGARGS